MTASRRRLLAAVGIVATGGCTRLVRTGDTPGGRTLPASETVTMGCDDRSTEYYFAPDLVRIRVGGTVSWRGGGTCRHLCTAYHPRFDRPRRIPADAAPWQGPDRRRGILTRRFPEAGIYDYYGLYEPFGQVGSVIVGDPDPTDQPGLAAPQASIPQAARRRLTDLNERTRRLLGG